MDKTWCISDTGTKVHAFADGKAVCNSRVTRDDVEKYGWTLEEAHQGPWKVCTVCEAKHKGTTQDPTTATPVQPERDVTRKLYTDITAHGEGDHLPLAETTAQRNERLTREHQDRLKSDPSYRQALADEFTGKTPAAKTRGDGVEREYTIRDEPQQKEEQTMKTTRSHLSPATITVRLDVADGPVHNQAFSTQGRMFQVERVSIEYKQDPATGVWLVQSEYDITVSGTTLKRDGTPSKNDHSRNPGCHFNGRVGFVPTPEWAWLDDVIERYAPIGGITVPE